MLDSACGRTLFAPESGYTWQFSQLRAAGLRVATWTANDPARVAELHRHGVDTVITDAVDVISPA